MLISNNDLINNSDADVQRYFNKILIASQKQSYNTIHLDIEPHTFANWKEKKNEYTKKYRNLLQVVKKICVTRKVNLAVSVPLNADISFVQDIKEYCNKIYVMAYETKNSAAVVKKLNENFSSVSAKLTIALRTNDFNSVSEMENYIKLISEKTGINRFAIHDLSRLMKMEN